MKPLNPLLYRQLQRLFGRVKLSNEGEAMRSHYGTDAVTKEPKLHIDHPGEYYQVCCPRCRDTRYRLYVNHKWGRRDEQGRLNLWLSICYNENCFSSGPRRRELFDDLNEIAGTLPEAKILVGEQVDLAARGMTLPGPTVRLNKLPADHPACDYLAGRFYDPDRLGRFYRVGYCPTSFYYHARHRIVAPVYAEGKLKGWQARYIGDMDWKRKDSPPKWFSCPGMQRAKLLYNLDEARKYKVVVIVEGPGDVWSFGPMAVASFGDTVTKTQTGMIMSLFGKHTCVLMLDPESMDKASTRDLCSRFRGQFEGGFVPVTLPKRTDPGSLARNFLRRYVRQAARGCGVRVSYKKRSA